MNSALTSNVINLRHVITGSRTLSVFRSDRGLLDFQIFGGQLGGGGDNYSG